MYEYLISVQNEMKNDRVFNPLKNQRGNKCAGCIESTVQGDFTNRFSTNQFNSQKWRPLFDQFDDDGFGEIPIEDFIIALTSPEFQTQVPSDKIELLYHHSTRLKEEFGLRTVPFQDFLDVVSDLFFFPVRRSICPS